MLLAVAVGAPSSARGERHASDPRALERRVRELERQNAELLRRLERLEQGRQESTAQAQAAPVAPSPAEEHAARAVPPAGHEHGGPGIAAALASVRGSYQVFADGGFGYRSAPERDNGHTAFALGTLDLFATGQVGDHFQAVTEIALEGSSEDNEFGFDVERLWGEWTFADWFYLKFGREHSPLSRWNRRFHHGRWMWTSATQPFVARFEDDGGPLPVHDVGLEAGGRLRIPGGTLEYQGVVSNGRGRTADEVQNFGDHNDNKAFDGGIGFAPTRWRGFGIGGAYHVDEIPPISGDPARRHSIGEMIESTYVEHFAGPLETLGEFAWIQHDDRTSNRLFHHRTGYLQLGYHLGRVTPFTRFDWRDMALGDPFYQSENVDLDQWEQMVGVRYDVTENFAFKLEGGAGREQRRHDDGAVSRGDFGRIAAQFALVF